MTSMGYLWRARHLVKIVVDETDKSTDLVQDHEGKPYLLHCLNVFKQIKPKYNNDLLARKTLAIATKKGYLAIDNELGKQGSKQRLKVSGDGLILLTPTGYLNAFGESVGNILAIVAIVISIIAIVVSLT